MEKTQKLDRQVNIQYLIRYHTNLGEQSEKKTLKLFWYESDHVSVALAENMTTCDYD